MTKKEVENLIALFESNADNNVLTMDSIKFILELVEVDLTTHDLINKLFTTTSIKGIILYADSQAESDGMLFGPCGLCVHFLFNGNKYSLSHGEELEIYDEDDDCDEIDIDDTDIDEDTIQLLTDIVESHYNDLSDGHFDEDSFEIHHGDTTGIKV